MPERTPAAQYLRMSTELQQYSFANQRRAIQAYAHKNGFEIVATYDDAAKSGVAITYRRGLTKLLQDVLRGGAPFKAILVYDISRWGRFQDVDEAAHYEFLCKTSGVPVHYCAEQFANDGTMPNSIMKALKRSMAGEYSRELSVKVFEAKKRLAELGCRLGSAPGFGLRRIAVMPDGRKRKNLAPGERKGFPGDHIALVPGSKSEVAWVRKIFSMFVRANGRLTPCDITRTLNHQAVPYLQGREWTQQSVRRLLANPKYAGYAVWGRTTQKLETRITRTPPDSWIVREKAFQPLVSERVFTKAQEFLEAQRQKRIPTEKILAEVRRVLRRHGRLCLELMGRANDAPCRSTLLRRFGSLKNLYATVGYEPRKGIFEVREHGMATEKLRNRLIDEILRLFPDELVAFRLPNASRRSSLLLDGKFRVYVWVCQPFQNQSRSGWYLHSVAHENNGVTLICTISRDKNGFDGFYVFPAIDVGNLQYSFDENDEWLARGVKLDNLSKLCETAREVIMRYAVPVRPHQGPLRPPLIESHKTGQNSSRGHNGLNQRVRAIMQAGERPANCMGERVDPRRPISRARGMTNNAKALRAALATNEHVLGRVESRRHAARA